MRAHRKNFIALCVALALLTAPAAGAEVTVQAAPAEAAAETAAPEITATHAAYLAAEEDGCFHPYAGLTRAEAAIALQTALELPAGSGCPYKDAHLLAGWYRAVCALWAAGALPQEEYFRPLEYITGAELYALLTALGLPADTLSAADTTPLCRGAFCVAVNAAAGRGCDEAALFLNNTPLFPDVPADSEYFVAVMEACAEHDVISAPGESEQWLCAETEPGLYLRQGRLYCLDENGRVLRDTQQGLQYFGPDGAYTTGSAELDAYVRELLCACVPDGQPGDYATLKTVYLYIKENYDYKNLGLSVEPFESVGWEIDRALMFLRNGGDTCFGFAAALGFAARGLGFEAYIISGAINEYYYPHSWVIIPYNGTDYIYDVELEYARPSRHGDGDLFGIRNGVIYNYWYDPWW